MALTDIFNIKAWAAPQMDGARDEALERCIDVADAWVKRVADWNIEEESGTVIYLNGDDRLGSAGNVLLMPPKYRPVTAATITEDDTSLSVAEQYDGSSDVYLVGANEERRCELVKPSSSWSLGYSNIKVTFTAGYAAASVPADIVQLATEVAVLFFRLGPKTAKAGRSGRGGSITFEKELTPMSLLTLERLRESAV